MSWLAARVQCKNLTKFKFAVLLAIVVFPGGAVARCFEHEDFVRGLENKFGEVPQSIAIDSRGNVIETFANLDTGTWSVLMTPPGLKTCLISAGTDFQRFDGMARNGDL